MSKNAIAARDSKQKRDDVIFGMNDGIYLEFRHYMSKKPAIIL